MAKDSSKEIIIPYFPKGLKYVTPLLIGAGIYLSVIGYMVFGVVLILISMVILTTQYVTAIDLKNKTIHDYLSFLMLPVNKESKKFNGLDRIVVVKGDYAQTVNTRAQSREFAWSDYTGILVFDDGDTLDLLTKNSKRELLLGLKEFVDFLEVGVEDQSTGDFYWVDMDKVSE